MNMEIELTKEEVKKCLRRVLVKTRVNKSEKEIEDLSDEILCVNKR